MKRVPRRAASSAAAAADALELAGSARGRLPSSDDLELLGVSLRTVEADERLALPGPDVEVARHRLRLEPIVGQDQQRTGAVGLERCARTRRTAAG